MFLIGEAGVNHEGSQEKAIDLVHQTRAAGWNAIKFQTYKSSSLAAKESPAYWDLTEESETSQYKLFKKHECFDLDWYLPIIEACNSTGIEFMTSLFDPELVETFDPYIQRYKISSSDITNHQLIKAISSKQKPIILSTGASTVEEITDTLHFLGTCEVSIENISLLHCVLNYPTESSLANILRISSISKAFGCAVGYSCHLKGNNSIEACKIAQSLGASIIEKHVTTTPFSHGNDHYHALDYRMMCELAKNVEKTAELLGDGLDHIDSQIGAKKNARRGLYFSKDLKIGTIISDNEIISLRPTHDGFNAEDLCKIIGKALVKSVSKGSPVNSIHF